MPTSGVRLLHPIFRVTALSVRFLYHESMLGYLRAPASYATTSQERIDQDPTTNNFSLWPTVQHTAIGEVRVDGAPVHMSDTDWRIEQGGPCLGEHTEDVLTRLLGMSVEDVQALREENVI